MAEKTFHVFTMSSSRGDTWHSFGTIKADDLKKALVLACVRDAMFSLDGDDSPRFEPGTPPALTIDSPFEEIVKAHSHHCDKPVNLDPDGQFATWEFEESCVSVGLTKEAAAYGYASYLVETSGD